MKSLSEFSGRTETPTGSPAPKVFTSIIVERLILARRASRESDPLAFITFSAIRFVAKLCDRPAIAVIWAHQLCVLAKGLNPEKVTIDHILEAFPDGMPTEDAYLACWDAQKSPQGNLLDDLANW